MIAPRIYESDGVALKRCRHGVMLYSVTDTFVGRSLDLYGEWCEAELDLLARWMTLGSHIIDVGANIGTHAIAFARNAGSTGFVWAFEPQRTAFHMLCANAALNALPNIQCLRLAVGATPGVIHVPTIRVTEPGNHGNLRLSHVAESAPAGDAVRLIRLDDLQFPACHLIKIDVEGMEADVLAGARQTIENHRPALFMENNTEEQSQATIEMIRSLGYRGWWHIAPYYSPRNYFANQTTVFSPYRPEANLLALPADAPVPPECAPLREMQDGDSLIRLLEMSRANT